MQTVAKQIFEYGLMSFNVSNYESAIDYFSTVLEGGENWLCRWYLAYSYQRYGKAAASRHQFLFIAEHCPDTALRQKAQEALRAICGAEEAHPAFRATMPGWLEVLRSHTAVAA